MLVDLSVALTENLSGFPGYPGFEREQLQSHGDDGKVSHRVAMTTHTGTHVDAPAHFIEGGETVEELSLDRFVGSATVVDLRAHRGGEITASMLSDSGSDIGAGDRVILATGDVDERFGGGNFFEDAAVLTEDAAAWLIDRGISLLANDFLTESIDDPARPVHHTLLGAGVPIVEYLRNIEPLIGQSPLDFWCFPLRISQVEAAPVRAIARLPE